jgi:hypothetical protein
MKWLGKAPLSVLHVPTILSYQSHGGAATRGGPRAISPPKPWPHHPVVLVYKIPLIFLIHNLQRHILSSDLYNLYLIQSLSIFKIQNSQIFVHCFDLSLKISGSFIYYFSGYIR